MSEKEGRLRRSRVKEGGEEGGEGGGEGGGKLLWSSVLLKSRLRLVVLFFYFSDFGIYYMYGTTCMGTKLICIACSY